MSFMRGIRILRVSNTCISESFKSSDGEEYTVTFKLSRLQHHSARVCLKWRESMDLFVTFSLYTDRNHFEKTNFCGGCSRTCACFENIGNHLSDMTLIISAVQCSNSISHVEEEHHHQLPTACTNHIQADVGAVNKVYAYHQRLSGDMKSLLETGKGSDIVLTDGNNEIPAHKLVLSLRSPVFAKMLQHKMKENIENKITIKDISLEVLKKMVEFLYSGEVIIDGAEMAINLYIAADKYNIDDLKAASSNVLINVDAQNVFEVLKLADLFDDKLLKYSAVNFMVQNYAELKSLEIWQTFLNENQTLAIEVLSCVVDSKCQITGV